ncbi:putative secreted protein (Por secretion system target) [Gillisia mitskevichiae]|uniref:Putative secreted protein (Por secretion system target) n=1 Tax=Gillisia mitskevichiae TaxID=270921 RepID=A0A495PLK8_9FLAO|nr:HYR domain-containing protein [Gillisia mitskevichiae]RKS50750.1 putative secreted protein (Por secretion system target) [Gillisia mitskevichiae]
MRQNYPEILWFHITRDTRLGQNSILFFGLMFFMLFSSLSGVGQVNVTPSYEWLDAVPFGTVTQAETSGLTIAIDTDSKGNVYRLTFGDGVIKYNSEGILLGTVISRSQLNDPLDVALDSNDNIYVIDYEDQAPFRDNGKIRKFNSSGVELNQIWTSYFRPLGLTLDKDDNIYVVIYNDGSGAESDVSSELRVYNKSGTEIKKTEGPSGHTLREPYRIGVDSNKNIYISHTANGGEVLVLNSSFQYLTTLTGMGSPGSVVIDEFDFIHVIDYSNRINFSQLLNYKNLTTLQAVLFALQIQQGINDKEFGIRIYDNNRILQNPFFKDQLELPVDIAFNSCDKMYVDNANITELDLFRRRIKIEFDLEIYERTPSFDIEKPIIVTCPSNITINTNPGENFAIVTYAPATATDNCSAKVTRTKGLASGSQFPIGPTLVEYTATDGAGNFAICSFTVTVNAVAGTDIEKPVITCPASITKNVDSGKCGAMVTFATATATDNSGEEITIVRTDNIDLNSGDIFPVGETIISFRATDGAGLIDECSFTITVVDNENPTISCPDDISETVGFGETGKVITYTAISFNDNCLGASSIQTAGFASGSEFPVGTTTNTFVVTDPNGNKAICSFDITITENEKQSPTFDCPDPNQTTILELDENCTFTVPDYSNRITNFENFENEPFFIQTQVRNGNVLTLTLRVFDGSEGEEAGSCQFLVNLEDQSPPAVICPNDIFVPYTGSKEYEIEDYFSLLTITDNCSDSFTYSQTPQPGVVISEDTRIEFTITDNNNNQSSCNFEVIFYEETELQILNCPENRTFEVDSNCSYLIPDIASTITTNIDGAVVTQNITPGFRVNGSLQLIITAKFEDQVDTCEVNLIAIDSINPLIICPGEQNETITEGEGFQLPNYILTSTYSDNCFIAEFKQQPEVGTIIYESTEVLLTVIDASGNPDSCSFIVNITSSNPDIELNCPSTQFEKLDENCQFLLPDYTPLSQVNFEAEVTQNPLPGSFINKNTDIILSAKGDVGTTTCVFKVMVEDATSPVAICIESMDLMLNANGQASLNPDSVDDNSYDACGIISKTLSQSIFTSADLGENTVLFTVTDAAGNSDFCETIVKVLPYDENAPDFSCIESLIIELDENGEAQIKPEDLYTGNGAGYEFSIDKSIFTCADKGSNDIQLTYTNGTIQGSCEVEVIVKDTSAPLVRVKDISVALNEFGSVSITAEMLDNGSSDNCGNLSFNISKLTFGCKELGENIVTFTATDSSGNSSSTTAIVTVTGDCNINPLPGVEYIYIYPNPTSGPFQFATPSGVTIQRVEIFDFRGRMILFKDFSETDFQYSMDLSGVQNAVYVLKLFTSEGIEIKRVIIE